MSRPQTTRRTIWICLLVQVLLFYGTPTDSAREVPPTIELYENRDAWEYVLNGSGLYSRTGATLYARCVAQYPVEWEVNGHVELNIVNIRPFVRTDGGSKFQADLTIFFYEDQYPAAAWIKCKPAQSSTESLQRKLAVFVPGERGRVFVKDEATVRDTSVLPCQSTNPFTQVQVEKVNHNGPNEIITGKYHPATGFTFADQPSSSGLFICQDRRSAARMQIKLEISNEDEIAAGFQFLPSTVSVRAFTGDDIQFECKNIARGQVKNDDMQVVATNTRVVQYIQRDLLSKVFIVNSPSEASGRIVCKSGQVSRQWTYEFITPPQLYLDNHEGELDCLSDNGNKSVSSVRCKNPSDCKLWSRCLQTADPTSSCNTWKPNYISSNRSTRCWTGKAGSNCVSLPYVHFNGIVQCAVGGGLTQRWEYFVGLRQQRFTNWQDAELDELIRLDPVEVSRARGTTRIFCEATSFLFADSLRIRLELKNGRFIDVTGEDNVTTISANNHPRQMDEYNVVKEVNVQLPPDLKAIHCYAPWWNSTDWMNTTAKFVTAVPL